MNAIPGTDADSGIHPAPVEFSADALQVDPILHFFHYAHLPAALQASSRPFCLLAASLVENLPRGPERTVALRKLLESKDAAVRANVASGSVKTETFLDRLKTEHREVKDRLRKLAEFLRGEQQGVSPRQYALLCDQKAAMESYCGILAARLEQLEIESAGGDFRSTARQIEDEPEVKEVGGADLDRDGPPEFRG